MHRRLLPPDPVGITPRGQRVQDGISKTRYYKNKKYMAKTNQAKATDVTDSLFQPAPQHRSKARKLVDVGKQRAKKPALAVASSTPASRVLPEIDVFLFPSVGAQWQKIQERVFAIPDPEQEHRELSEALRLVNALTPGNLNAALNDAENNALRAHTLYIVAKADYDNFDCEMIPVIDAMREAAHADLHGERERKERSKPITEADIRGRASVLYPDEWLIVHKRRVKAESMLAHLKQFSELWKQRCFSLSTLLNAGKRL